MKAILVFILLQYCVVYAAHIYKSQQGCISDPADIVFLLDSSGSIGLANFKDELDIVAKFAKHYVIGPNNVQIGIVSFSSTVHNEFDMNTHTNINDLENAIKNIKFKTGGTDTGAGLKFVRENSFKQGTGERNNVPNFLVVITDGQSNGKFAVTSEAPLLHNTNIEVFVIGVGRGINKAELDLISSGPKHVLHAKDHLDLALPLQTIRCPQYQTNKVPFTHPPSTLPATVPTTPTTQPTTTAPSTTLPTTVPTTPTTQPTTTAPPTTSSTTPTPTTQLSTTIGSTSVFTASPATSASATSPGPTTQLTTSQGTQSNTVKPTVKSVCNPSPCHNGATCLDIGMMSICQCAKGYTGPFCKRHVRRAVIQVIRVLQHTNNPYEYSDPIACICCSL